LEQLDHSRNLFCVSFIIGHVAQNNLIHLKKTKKQKKQKDKTKKQKKQKDKTKNKKTKNKKYGLSFK
jgi:uncharacterized membrane protein affecting hemolysin expression